MAAWNSAEATSITLQMLIFWEITASHWVAQAIFVSSLYFEGANINISDVEQAGNVSLSKLLCFSIQGKMTFIWCVLWKKPKKKWQSKQQNKTQLKGSGKCRLIGLHWNSALEQRWKGKGSAGRAASQGRVGWKCCCPCQQAENPGKIESYPVKTLPVSSWCLCLTPI